MEKDNLYIMENCVLTPLSESKNIICGLYAAIGYNGGKAGDLFAVVSGPCLFPVYDKRGTRKNVGADLGGMSYSFRRCDWYKE